MRRYCLLLRMPPTLNSAMLARELLSRCVMCITSGLCMPTRALVEFYANSCNVVLCVQPSPDLEGQGVSSRDSRAHAHGGHSRSRISNTFVFSSLAAAESDAND